MTHKPSCSIGGLVIARHNKILDELIYLYQCSFTSSYVRAEPLLHQGRTKSEQEIFQGSDEDKETWGDVMVLGLWDRQVEAIINFKLGDADMDTYQYEPMTALLSRWEKTNKDKHGKHCRNQRKHFSPFFLSVERMLGREALALISQLSLFIA